MKCAICKKKTTWDESFGYIDFIVCPKCHDELVHHFGGKDVDKGRMETMKLIFKLGDIREKAKGK